MDARTIFFYINNSFIDIYKWIIDINKWIIDINKYGIVNRIYWYH